MVVPRICESLLLPREQDDGGYSNDRFVKKKNIKLTESHKISVGYLDFIKPFWNTFLEYLLQYFTRQHIFAGPSNQILVQWQNVRLGCARSVFYL